MSHLVIYFYRISQAGGAERIVCGLANALSTRGYRVHLVSWDAANAVSYYDLSADVIWHRLGFHPGLKDKVRRTVSLARLLRRERIQAFIGFVMSGDKSVYAAAKLAGVPLIAAERNAPSMYHLRYSPFQRWQNLSLLRLVDRIVVQFADFSGGYPRSLRNRIETIPNPVDAADRTAIPGDPNTMGRYTLLAVSRLDEIQKRLTCLIDAFSRIALNHPLWDLEIVGDGPDGAVLFERIEILGLKDRIRIVPSYPNVYDRYSECHLFATPSLWEGFPNALAEAMVHGLPAVGFAAADGVAHLIEEGETGWLADGVDDPQAFARTLDNAMADGPERERRGANAVRAMTAFVPERQYARWQRLVDEVTRDNRVAVPA